MESAIILNLLKQLIEAEDLTRLCQEEERARYLWEDALAELKRVEKHFDPANTADPDALSSAKSKVDRAHNQMVAAEGYSRGYEAGLKRVKEMITATLDDAWPYRRS